MSYMSKNDGGYILQRRSLNPSWIEMSMKKLVYVSIKMEPCEFLC